MDGWKNKNGILQIYPRSYRDANGDGVGDLRGIIESLSYIKGETDSLNIDAIWLSPFYPSPMADFGYDIADYCDVDPLFGTIDDFKALVQEAHSRGISVMIDLIPNHTSSEHSWFKEALRDPSSPKRDYYIFRDGKGNDPPNNWLSVFGGSSWEKVEGKNEYYLHSFLKEQPDLNWQKTAVQDEFRKIVRFWCELGVDGFRVDAIRWMGKDLLFKDEPINPRFKAGDDPYNQLLHIFSQATPELDAYLKVLTNAAKEFPNTIILFEAYTNDDSPAESQLKRLYDVDSMVAAPFHFGGIQAARSPKLLAEVANIGKAATPAESLPFYCFGNHDKPRLIGRVGEDVAKAIALIQLTLPGVPVIYYGEEIGMPDVVIPPGQIQDPFEKRVPGKGLGRDSARTPMQWNATFNAGFTDKANPWLPLSESYQEKNVELELKNDDSILRLYQHLLYLRSTHAGLRQGIYKELFVDDDIYMYEMRGKDRRYIIVANLGYETHPITLPKNGTLLCKVNKYDPEFNYQTGAISDLASGDALLIMYKNTT